MLSHDDISSCATNTAQNHNKILRNSLSSIGKLNLSDIPKVAESEISLKLGISGVGKPSASVNARVQSLGFEILKIVKAENGNDGGEVSQSHLRLNRSNGYKLQSTRRREPKRGRGHQYRRGL